MVKFTMQQLRGMMRRQENIRNISVIAHVDHGKTTLTDTLLGKCGCALDTMKEEQERGITIKSTSISLFHQKLDDEQKKQDYLINLIDCPGHVDFSSEVTAALRVTDGALVVVDCIEGVCVQTETVLRQAIEEKIVPVLFLNKVDRIFLEQKPDLNEIYNIFHKAIHSVNTVIQTYSPNSDSSMDLLPTNGKVGFGSGLHGWGFTLKEFAQMYCGSFGLSIEKMMEKLWGDNYWHQQERKWVKNDHNGTLERGFVQFILRPLKVLFDSIMEDKKEIYLPIVKSLGISSMISKDELNNVKKPKDYLKLVMKYWLPSSNTLLSMICEYLPNPIIAQSYRTDNLYSGPLDSIEAQVLRSCDDGSKNDDDDDDDTPKDVPMVFYVSKMVPTKDNSRFIAFGRVFSGTVKTGQEVIILNEPESDMKNLDEIKNDDINININNNVKKALKVKVQKCVIMMGKSFDPIDEVPCGNVCGLVGIDRYLSKSGTLVGYSHSNINKYSFLPLKTMNFSVSPIVQQCVNVIKPNDLPKLLDGLRKLSKFDNLIEIIKTENGENVICGAGELHLETCINTLRTMFLPESCKIKVDKPIVKYNETILGYNENILNNETNKPFPKICVSKSTNKLNRIYCESETLLNYDNSEKFLNNLEKNKIKYLSIIKNKDGLKQLSNQFINNYNDIWNNKTSHEIRNIWSFGALPDASCNILIDQTKGIQLMKDIKSDVISAWKQTCLNGVLCNEPIRGIKIKMIDAKIHSDKVHRNAASIIPMSRRCFSACQIANQSRLMEPMFLVDITVNKTGVNGVYNTLRNKRGTVEDMIDKIGTPITNMKCYLPVSESFGFSKDLGANTSGKAFASMQFSHWQIINDDPYSIINNDNNNKKKGSVSTYDIIMDIRKRKGLKPELPKFADYFDRIN